MVKTYTCKKCLKTFSQKSHYKAHKKNKTPCQPIVNEIKKLAQEVYDENKAEDLVKRLNHLFENFQKLCDIHEPNFGSQGYKLKEGKYQEQMIQILDFLKNLKNLDEKRYDSLYNDKEWNLFIMAYGDISLKKDNSSELKMNKVSNDNNTIMSKSDIVWTAPIDDMDDSKELAVVDAIKRCHDITRKEGIVGEKAMNDIMCIVSLQQLEKLIENNTIELNINKKLKQKKEFVYFSYLKNLHDHDLRNDDKSDGIRRAGKILNRHPLLKQIFTRANFLHMKKARNIRKVFDIINNLDLDIDDPAGAIYMTFITDYFKSGSKLGQFFTPRKLIKLINNGLIPEDLLKSLNIQTIMDNFMGTAGFIVYMRKRLQELGINIEPENINGIEVEPDTYKYAFLNMLLTTGRNCENLNLADALAENTMNQKADFIQTNPPFSLKGFNYKDLMDTYEDKELFKKVFPIKTNDGTSLCLQSIIYRTKKIGMIILPDGKQFFGNNFKKLRKWICDNVNVLKILKVPSGTFDHTGIATAIILFTKETNTKEINFYKTNRKCNYIKSICKVDIKTLKENNYSFDLKDYVEDESLNKIKNNSSCNWNKLKDLFEFISGKKRKVTESLENGNYPFITASTKKHLWINEYDYDDDALIINSVNATGKCKVYYAKKYCTTTNNIHFKLKDSCKNKNNIKYFYYFLNNNIKLLENKFSGCSKKKITNTSVANVDIPVPSIEVQNEIVEQLESLEKQKQNFDNTIKFTKKEMEFYMNCKIKKACKNNCEWKNLKKLVKINYGSSKKISKEIGNYPFMGGGEKPVRFVKDHNVEANVIIVARSGNPGIISKHHMKSWVASYAYYLELIDKNINNNYLYYYLKKNQSNIQKLSAGTCQKNLNRDVLYKFKIPVIDMKLQNIIVNYLNDRQNEINNLEIRKTQIDELMKEILESSFTGDSNEEEVEEEVEEKVEENESE